jgi:hypothetical protein
MSAAGLRMTILQEVVRQKDTPGARKNLDLQKEKAVGFHDEIVKLVDERTEPSTHVAEFMKAVKVPVRFTELELKDANVLGHRVSGKVLLPGGRAPTFAEAKKQVADFGRLPFKFNLINWDDLRTRLRADNTDLGEKMVARWLGKKR